jgi:Phosphorylase superfamily
LEIVVIEDLTHRSDGSLGNMTVEAIFVPQGAEYDAVRRGAQGKTIEIIALPVGPAPVQRFLEKLPLRWRSVVIMGLCGSLAPECKLGDAVLYETCVCDNRPLLKTAVDLSETLEKAVSDGRRVQALTVGKILCTAGEKRQQGRKFQAQVVDMETYPILEILSRQGISVSALRVVSDDWDQDLPQMQGTVDAQGNLQPLPLAFALLSNPLAGMRLVSSSLQALAALEQLIKRLPLTGS